jgi:hypothetical protein
MPRQPRGSPRKSTTGANPFPSAGLLGRYCATHGLNVDAVRAGIADGRRRDYLIHRALASGRDTASEQPAEANRPRMSRPEVTRAAIIDLVRDVLAADLPDALGFLLRERGRPRG